MTLEQELLNRELRGYEEGREEGLATGRAEGLATGRSEGLATGRAESAHIIAQEFDLDEASVLKVIATLEQKAEE